jgi:arylsulfatase A-like enzyme
MPRAPVLPTLRRHSRSCAVGLLGLLPKCRSCRVGALHPPFSRDNNSIGGCRAPTLHIGQQALLTHRARIDSCAGENTATRGGYGDQPRERLGGQKSLWFCIVLLAAAALSGCAAMPDERRATFGIRFPPPVPADKPTAIVFMIDGVNRDVFDRMLQEGRLPNFKKYFVDRGLYYDRCVANVPGVTLPSETSIVTGVFPGRHGITGNSWFDRSAMIERNYEELAEKNLLDGDYRAETIFERLHDATTVSLFHQAHRGATRFVENRLSGAPPYVFGLYGLVDRISLWRFDIVANIARAQGRFPALVFSYLLAADMEAYRAGVSSEAYRWALEHDDAHIGRVLRDLEVAGRLDNTVLAIVSDHGMVDVAQHWPLEKFFRDEVHLRIAGEGLWEDTVFEDRLAWFGRYEVILEGSGDRYWAVYLRKPRAGVPGAAAARKSEEPAFENWPARPAPEDLRAYPMPGGKTVNLIERLLAAEAVDVLAYRGAAGKVHVATKKGEVELSRPAPDSRDVACRVLRGDDPLGYAASKAAALLDGKPHTPAEWLVATAETEHPDLAPQVMAYFDSPRAGDLALFAASGWDFGYDKKGGHGGLTSGDMCTVLLLAGPGVPHERRSDAVRSVDLVPTILQLLGRPVPADIDGRSLIRR